MSDKTSEGRIAKLEGQVEALEVVVSMLMYEMFRNPYQEAERITRVNLAIKELTEDYTRIPFMLSDEVAEGFRSTLQDVFSAFNDHDDTPPAETYGSS